MNYIRILLSLAWMSRISEYRYSETEKQMPTRTGVVLRLKHQTQQNKCQCVHSSGHDLCFSDELELSPLCRELQLLVFYNIPQDHLISEYAYQVG